MEGFISKATHSIPDHTSFHTSAAHKGENTLDMISQAEENFPNHISLNSMKEVKILLKELTILVEVKFT